MVKTREALIAALLIMAAGAAFTAGAVLGTVERMEQDAAVTAWVDLHIYP